MTMRDLVRGLRLRVIASGLIAESDFDELGLAARAHIDDPTTVMARMLYVTIWGES
jgi:hypothetical protein